MSVQMGSLASRELSLRSALKNGPRLVSIQMGSLASREGELPLAEYAQQQVSIQMSSLASRELESLKGRWHLMPSFHSNEFSSE